MTRRNNEKEGKQKPLPPVSSDQFIVLDHVVLCCLQYFVVLLVDKDLTILFTDKDFGQNLPMYLWFLSLLLSPLVLFCVHLPLVSA